MTPEHQGPPGAEPPAVGTGYATAQLARALSRAQRETDPSAQLQAQGHVERWTAALLGQVAGTLQPGERTPVKDMPAWATLEVVRGGFVTGAVLSGGPLQPHERDLLLALGMQPATDADAREALNVWFLTEPGQARLGQWLQSGCYAIDVPEEGALLAVAQLLRQGHGDAARGVVDALAPYFSRLRFYPRPVATAPPAQGRRVHLQDAGTTVRQLQDTPANPRVDRQKESVTVWTPLYDEIVALFLDTVVGDPPRARRQADGGWQRTPAGGFVIDGGWPAEHYPEGWEVRAHALLQRFEQLQQQHTLCSRPHRSKTSLGSLLVLLAQRLRTPERFERREAGRVRLVLARYVSTHGLPASESCQHQRALQWGHANAPSHRQIALQVAARLHAHPADEGLDDMGGVLLPVQPEETRASGLPEGTLVPASVHRKVQRCLAAPLQELVRLGVVTSAEVLATLVPQITARLRAEAMVDEACGRLYAAIYAAFRQRRSLLLLNLARQVQLEELPWLAALGRHSRRKADAHGETDPAALQVLREVVVLSLTAFPFAILPNKLVRELDALARTAGMGDMPLTEEVAAGIFMGRFSAKYASAALQAWRVVQGTIYARYYGIELDAELVTSSWLGRLKTGKVQPPSLEEQFSDLCTRRAGTAPGKGFSVARNGTIIEQQQVLTTHNLAVLVGQLGLQQPMAAHFMSMAQECFAWVLQRLQVRVHASDWHSRLVHTKNAAYAWRQMVFFLAMLEPLERKGEAVEDFLRWAHEQLAAQPRAFAARLRPALVGLAQAASGPVRGEGRVFLGWSQGVHWLG